ENKDQNLESNERLEFLGDAVLQFLSTEYLFNKFKHIKEGTLTAYRAALVNTNSLAEESKRLGFGKFLRLSKGEELNKGRENTYILANTFEAVLGALYLDQGLEKCKKFLEKNLFYKIDRIIKEEAYKDKKSGFQEIAQEEQGITPTYKVIREWGPDHNKKFEVAVYLGKDKIATGVGSSKQKAEIEAAKKAIEKYKSKNN
ncbi:MAG TPA: ribonuclease III, partial [candidate division WWE3 bacterium]|nr:ribonuclease III [candidate division WWE3 bacterium]